MTEETAATVLICAAQFAFMIGWRVGALLARWL